MEENEDSIYQSSKNVEVDIENPLEQKEGDMSTSQSNAEVFLQNVITTGKLGKSRPEKYRSENESIISLLIYSIPYKILIGQTIWTLFVTLTVALTNLDKGIQNSLFDFYWETKFSISSSVSADIGWALFVLLGFLLREASQRHREAEGRLNKVFNHIIELSRHLIQAYPKGSWHDGDRNRIMSHLVAYPIALKMTLRSERDASQIQNILNPNDVDDVLKDHEMHIRCLNVVRAYFTSAENGIDKKFVPVVGKVQVGNGSKYICNHILDEIDLAANGSVWVKDFSPSEGYLNHLRLFLYIWLFFLPLEIVTKSGWFTIIWTLLISYGVGMIYFIANALYNPYGFDIQGLHLNRLCARISLKVLRLYTKQDISTNNLISGKWDTPKWLHEELEENVKSISNAYSLREISKSFIFEFFNRMQKKNVFLPLLVSQIWLGLFTLAAWLLSSEAEGEKSCRWWCNEILPGDDTITNIVASGLFLILSFWLVDCYNRYWRSMKLWKSSLQTMVIRLCSAFRMVFDEELWHEGDRERIFSYLAALPLAVKQYLQGEFIAEEFMDILSPQDILNLANAENLPKHIFHVLYGYINSLDSKHKNIIGNSKSTVSGAYTKYLPLTLWITENVVTQLDTIRKVPMSRSFTLHVKVFSGIWLAMLPMALIDYDGFLSLIYGFFISYSIINLIALGDELSHPFGKDSTDVPMDDFCKDMRLKVKKIFHSTKSGFRTLVKKSEYSRNSFSAYSGNDFEKWRNVSTSEIHENVLTPKRTWRNIKKFFPSVPWKAQVFFIIWAFVSVTASYFLQFTWKKEIRESCTAWCSPIDVNKSVLSYIGFAVFMILGFRASEAFKRYDEGGKSFYLLEKEVRTLATGFVQTYSSGTWHEMDLERIIAHMVQIPLAVRDELHAEEQVTYNDTLLSKEDYKEMKNSPCGSLLHCMYVIQTYLISADRPDSLIPGGGRDGYFTVDSSFRIGGIIEFFGKMMLMKEYPVVRNYTDHQQLFTAIWLMLLPLGMTASSGWFTVFLAPIISYGVLSLEDLALMLMDPFGHDKVDLHIDEMAKKSAAVILDAVESVRWGCDHHILENSKIEQPTIGLEIQGGVVKHNHGLATLCQESNEETPLLSNCKLVDEKSFGIPSPSWTERNLYAHFVRSVPWWIILGVGIYSTIICVLTYVTSDEYNPSVRWWQSPFTVEPLVASYVGFATFFLLGFYVEECYARYLLAGRLWLFDIQESLHSLTTKFLLLFPSGASHEGDIERIIGHIASIPIVLKMELRGERNLMELKGLLSKTDIGRVHCAQHMTKHCIDVVKTYIFSTYVNPDAAKSRETTKSIFGTPNKVSFAFQEIRYLEDAVQKCFFVKDIEIAPGALVLLRTLLGIWILIIPFVLSHVSGWFSILWISLISYGLLGYVIGVHCNYKSEPTALIDENPSNKDSWFVEKDYQEFYKEIVTMESNNRKWRETFEGKFKWFKLARHATPVWIFMCSLLWSSIIYVLATIFSSHWIEYNEGSHCSPWICSPIAESKYTKEFVGYALFLLLGFRLVTNHKRYVKASQIWRENLIGHLRILSFRIFQANTTGGWHERDLERIAGHLAAYPYAVMVELRGQPVCVELLEKILGPSDTKKMCNAHKKSAYCIDVVQSYLMRQFITNQSGPGRNLTRWLSRETDRLKKAGMVCQGLQNVPMPYGYIIHLRVFLVIWLALLPLGLFENSGWITIIWVLPITFGIVGIQRWSEELENPYGKNLADVPLEQLCREAVQVVLESFHSNDSEKCSFIVPERKAPLDG